MKTFDLNYHERDLIREALGHYEVEINERKLNLTPGLKKEEQMAQVLDKIALLKEKLGSD